ncbi:MAG TPA: hypothetical protein VF543_22300 [Pyrinomonadaceae bacterium]|jgi:hypothetical protein
MKHSYEHIFRFIEVAATWLKNNPKETKFHYGLMREMTPALKLNSQYKELVEDIDIKHCATDERGVILRDERGGYQFTKEGLNERNKERRKLFRSEVEIEPYYVTEVPDNLSPFEREAFAGFVINPESVEEVAQTGAGA